MGLYRSNGDSWINSILNFICGWCKTFKGWRFTFGSLMALVLVFAIDTSISLKPHSDLKWTVPIMGLFYIAWLLLLFIDFFSYFLFYLNPMADLENEDFIKSFTERRRIKNKKDLVMQNAGIISSSIADLNFDIIRIFTKINFAVIQFILIFAFAFKGIARSSETGSDGIVDAIGKCDSLFKYFCFSAMNYSTLGMSTVVDYDNMVFSGAIVLEVATSGIFAIICIASCFSYVFQQYSSFPNYMSKLYEFDYYDNCQFLGSDPLKQEEIHEENSSN